MVAKRKYILYIMDYSRKKTKQGGWWGWGEGEVGTYFFEPPFLWKVFYFALGNYRQNKASSLENPQNWAITEKKKKNSRVFQIVVRGGGGFRNFIWGDFFTRWRKPEEEWFWQFKPFSKLKTAFCEYWTSIKIKIKMMSMKLKQKWSRNNDYS